ncbi:Protein CBG20453 [Caenorhabditis briggsae]|uniref:Protein CBG20453 n=1 Tax=Caenorhabditis briggsae TaxID=6238 RepID=A8XXT5_CAEBR|nr:Protein CBG20453 [Caenorhabditis briggsae]CAP37454.1 Protein CBG20453 [Caenorhabditis briggsae]
MNHLIISQTCVCEYCNTVVALLSMTGKEFTLKYEFENVGELEHSQSLSSPEEEYFGVKWKIRIHKWNEILNLFLHTNLSVNQEIQFDYTTKIFSKNKKKISLESGSGVMKVSDQSFFCDLIDWKTMEEEYLNDGKLEVEFHVKITEMIGFPKEELRSFGEEMKQFSDVVLKIEDRKFYISKLYLASQSPYFATLFMGKFQESEKSEIELKDVNPDDFQCFLEVIYAEDAIDDDTVERILQIADMYETPLAIKKCEKFLIKKSKMELKKKLELTEKYGLEESKKAYQKPI